MTMPLNQKEIIINSETVKLIEVENFIEDVFISYGLSLIDFNRAVICVKEAVTNSIVHGNKLDKKKQVNIKAYKCSKYLYFKIVDEGEGFNPEMVKDPTESNNLLNESGRGLFIIKNVCDGVTFKEQGKVIEFKINLHEKC
jgi:serine/threonine-protein kinase RsbW